LTSRARRAAPLAAFAALCYGPLLATEPGVVVADTKTYLTIDPGRLLARSLSMWDPHVATGGVTHQTIGYLWPMGPYYWLCERIGAPDWAAQRVWLASILFLAGLGMRYLLRTFGWRGPAVGAAMVVYALTPYTLTVAARISTLLLSFTALPWLLALTIRAVRTRSWYHPALFALVVATAGTLNATAIILVGVAPVLWLPFAVWVEREASVRQAMATAARIGVLTVATNAWWIAGLSVQATNGIDVPAYTETVEVIAMASLAHEVLRGLGYWFFYGEDRLGPWIEPSVQYTQRLWLLSATYLLPALALAAGAVARWRHRAYFVVLLVVGLTLAVGAHPFADPSPAGAAIKAFLLTDRGLAMRSLPRAVPLVALSLAVLLAAGIAALAQRRPVWGRGVAVVAIVLAVAAYAPLWQRGLVPQNLRRDEELPSYWLAAADHLTATDDGTRVLEIPGSDFASYRWGNTVDPITTGLTDRPVVARELVPGGSPPAADLLNAFDAELQAHVAEPTALAPVARLLRAGQVLVRSDLQYERYNTPRPRELWEVVRRAPGLGDAVAFGDPVPNTPRSEVPMQDEVTLAFEQGRPHPPPVAVVPVDDPVPIVTAHGADHPLVVAGDGAGLVDLAAAGLLDGDELLLASASLDDEALDEQLDRDAVLVLTDTNRRRGERWQGVRFNRGYTEPPGYRALRADHTDNRLPVFPGAGDDTRTVALHRGGLLAAATSYGNAVDFAPEHRPANAFDGDVETAWRAGDAGPIVGEHLVAELDRPERLDEITLVQPLDDDVNRWITAVRLRFDGDDAVDVALDESSRTIPGQRITFPARTFRTLDIEVRDDTAGRRPRYPGVSSAGFAEVRVGDHRLDEVVRLPVDLLGRAGAASADRRLAVVLTRLRSEATLVTRDDEEPSMRRLFELPSARSFALGGSARLSSRAGDDVVSRLLGLPDGVVASSGRLPAASAWPGGAFDGDAATAWTAAFGEQSGQWVELSLPAPAIVAEVQLRVADDDLHSMPTRVGIDADGVRVATVEMTGETATATLPEPVAASRLRLVVDEVDERTTIDWQSRRRRTLPVSIAEVAFDGVAPLVAAPTLDTGCRDDLVTVDDAPLPVVVRGTVADALAGRPLDVATCDAAPLRVDAGEVVVRTAPGRTTGIDVDRLVLRSAADDGPDRSTEPLVRGVDRAAPAVEVRHDDGDRLSLSVSGAQPHEPFWLSFGQSLNGGWRATVDGGGGLGAPRLIDGFANGWLVDPPTSDFAIELTFAPQRRVDVALLLSAGAALLCVLVASLGLARRRRADGVGALDEWPRPSTSVDAFGYQGSQPSNRRTAVAAALLVAVAAVLVHPLAGLVAAVVSVVGLRWRGARRLVVVAAPLAMLAAGAYVVAWQVRYDIPPGLEWPQEFWRAHPLGWAAALALLTDVVVGRVWSRRWE
jgi:arabinofuranan 3-O-arabinosyltransferase